MAQERIPAIKKNTPIGIAKWPKLSEPDYGTADYPKPEGEYSVKLIFEEANPAFQKFRDEMEPFIAEAEAAAKTAFAALAKASRDKLGGTHRMNPLFTPIYDENDEPTGHVELKLSMKASGVVKKGPREGKKWNRAPNLFDALGRPIKDKVEIWGGSELICAFNFQRGGYFIAGTGVGGLKVSLEAVQIVTLRQGGERSASDYGFGKQEGGFDVGSYASKSDDNDDEFAGSGNNPADMETPPDPEGAAGF